MGQQSNDDLEFKFKITQTAEGKDTPLSVTTLILQYPSMPNFQANMANTGMTLAAMKGLTETAQEFAIGKVKASGDPEALKMLADMLANAQPETKAESKGTIR